jgi:glutamyl-tRNA reductase
VGVLISLALLYSSFYSPVRVVNVFLAEEYNKGRVAEVEKAERIVGEEVQSLELFLRRRWVEERWAGLLSYWVKIAEKEGERAGGGLAKTAALSAVKKSILPLINYTKYMALEKPEEADRLISILERAYKIK